GRRRLAGGAGRRGGGVRADVGRLLGVAGEGAAAVGLRAGGAVACPAALPPRQLRGRDPRAGPRLAAAYHRRGAVVDRGRVGVRRHVGGPGGVRPADRDRRADPRAAERAARRGGGGGGRGARLVGDVR